MNTNRFDIFLDKHIGFGIRWENEMTPFSFEIAISIPFITINIGFGKKRWH